MTVYTKPARSFDEQVDLLVGRGMQGKREQILQRLATVNYYRLSGYWYPFRKPDPTPAQPVVIATPTPPPPDPNLPPRSLRRGKKKHKRKPKVLPSLLDDFMPGTEFEVIWDRYVFDQRLKLLVMEAVERIEVAVRTQLAYHHAHRWSPDAYVSNAVSLPRLLGLPNDLPSHVEFCKRVKSARTKAKDMAFVQHFSQKYPDSDHLPIWMATEIMSFGEIVTMYRGCDDQDQIAVANHFGVTHTVLRSWLNTLQNVRNICAHHGRLWNRKLVKLPQLPAQATHPDWYAPVAFGPDRIFAALTICTYMLNVISPTSSSWPQRVTALVLNDHKSIPLDEMGFPTDWQKVPLWNPVSPTSVTPPASPTPVTSPPAAKGSGTFCDWLRSTWRRFTE